MKLFPPTLCLATLLFSPILLNAANYTWVGSGTVAAPGSGVWDLTATNLMWNTGSNVPWVNGNTAIFGGVDGTYSIGPVGVGTISANGLTFNNNGYTLTSPAASTVVLNAAVASPVTLASGKTATIGNNVTVSRAAALTVTGPGTLVIASGGKLNGSTGPSEITGGATVEVQSGGQLNMNTSMVVGAFNVGANNNGTLTVNGGAVAMTNTTGNFVLGNLITAGATTTATVNMNSGTLSVVAASPRGVRFGNNTQSAGTVTATFNLNGGTVTTPFVSKGVVSAAGVINSTFNFNGGTLVANKTSTTFFEGLGTANVKGGGANIDTGAFDITIAQNLLDGTGGGGLTKLGAAVLTLTGNNTYTGTTRVAAGTLNVGSGGATGALGTGPVVLETANPLTINRTGSVTIPGAISGVGGVTLVGGAQVTLSGTSTYTGATAVNAGKLELTGSLTSDVTLASGTSLAGEGATSGALNFTGTHTLTFDPATPGSLRAQTINASAATVTLVTASAASGTGFVVLEAPGGISGPISNFAFVGRGTPYFNAGKTQLLFDYAPASLKWKGQHGANPTFWDTNATSNWVNGASDDKFVTGDTVLFDDTASTFTVAIQPGGATAGVVTFDNTSNSYTLMGDALLGATSLVKRGTNTLVVANPNSYTGGTTIFAGVLQLGDGAGANGSLGTGGVVLNGDLVTSFGANNVTMPNVLSGTGNFTQNGTGIVSLTGTNTFSGVLNIASGSISVGAAGTTGTLGTASVNNSGTLNFNRTDALLNVSNVISGPGAVNQVGSGQTTLSGANTYDGLTTVVAGALLVTQPAALGGTLAGTVVNSPAELRLQGGITVTGESLTLNGGGSGAGLGALRGISGNNVWTGNITAVGVAGITRISSDGDLLTISGNIAMGVGITDQLVVQGLGNMEVSGVISGISRLTCSSNGNATSTRTLSGQNTYTGQTLINGGTLSVSSLNSVNGGTPALAASSLGAPTTVANGTINLAGATGTLRYTGTGETTDRVLNLNGASFAGSLEQAGTGNLAFTSNVIVTGGGVKTLNLVGSTAGTGEIVGSIPDNSVANKTNVAKSGSGKWTLSGDNPYTGNTTVSAGILALGATGRISLSPLVSIASGAKFDVSAQGTFTTNGAQTVAGAGQVLGNLAVVSGGNLSPGVGAGGIGTLTVSGSLTLDTGSNFTVDLAASGNDKAVVASAVTLGGAVVVNNPTAVTGTFPILNYSGSLTGSLTVTASGPLFYSVNTATPGVVNLIVSATPPGFATWQGITWPGVTDPAIIGPQADPDRDGIANLVEYALGLDATTASNTRLPVPASVTDAGVNYLALQIKRPAGSRADLTYEGQFSDSMTEASWTAGVQVGSVVVNGDGTETVTFRDTVPNTQPRRYGRLQVRQIP